ncbi:MAG: pyridoxamine 5'-phosphate oxidase family protein [Rikenellaceae bacterium]
MEKSLPKEIKTFIKEHHVMTLATISNGMPYCSNLFYAFIPEKQFFVFTSSLATEHAQNIIQNSNVAASIVVETKIVGKVRGVQLCGNASRAEGSVLHEAKMAYLKRFPYAIFADLELWQLKVTFAKLTDNRLGFGKKIIWNSDEK